MYQNLPSVATLPAHIRMCIYFQNTPSTYTYVYRGRLQLVPDDFSSVHHAQLLVHGRRVND